MEWVLLKGLCTGELAVSHYKDTLMSEHLGFVSLTMGARKTLVRIILLQSSLDNTLTFTKPLIQSEQKLKLDLSDGKAICGIKWCC